MQLAVTLNFWSLCLCFISAGVLGLHHHARFMACWDQTWGFTCARQALYSNRALTPAVVNSFNLLIHSTPTREYYQEM